MCVGGSSLPWGGVGQGRESPQFLPEISGLTPLEVGLKTFLPNMGGVAPITAQLL